MFWRRWRRFYRRFVPKLPETKLQKRNRILRILTLVFSWSAIGLIINKHYRMSYTLTEEQKHDMYLGWAKGRIQEAKAIKIEGLSKITFEDKYSTESSEIPSPDNSRSQD